MTEDSQHLNITDEGVMICSELAKHAPSQSPLPERIPFHDHILWRIGDWKVRRPLKEALLDVLIDHVKYTFGKEWAEAQYALPEDERHVVVRWWFRVCEAQKNAAPQGHRRGQLFAIPRTGDVTEFGYLADDIYRLRLAEALPRSLVDRLRSVDQYQGARYEVAVAASLVRSGFDIKWVDGHAKHCEFEATHTVTNETIAVEAKSRHVSGTLNQSGKTPNRDDLRFVAHRYYNDALKQCPTDKPCAIFIDLNLPPESITDDDAIPWWEEMKRMFDALPKPTLDKPALESCLVLTNFSAHYSKSTLAPNHRYVFWFPRYVRHTLKKMSTFVGLIRAMETYGQIPSVE